MGAAGPRAPRNGHPPTGFLARKLFSRRSGYRSVAFLLTGLVSLGAYALVARIPDGSVPGWALRARRSAVKMAERGQAAIRAERRRMGLPLRSGDRLRTGLIGVESSAITTELGSLSAKRTSTDPVFAAAVVDMLYRAGVRPGDVVAIGMTGSFPAFDLDVEVAVEAIEATPVTISSVGASQWGADEPELNLLVMEETLVDAGVTHHRSIAVDPGGTEIASEAEQPEAEARRSAAVASGLPVVPPLPLDQEIEYRLDAYDRAAAGLGVPVSAFVNVGGSAADIGSAGDALIEPGLSRPRWGSYEVSRLGVVGRMAERGLPVVNLLDVARLAERYDIAWDPASPSGNQDLPAPPPHPLAVAVALAALLAMVALAHRAGAFRLPTWDLPRELRTGSPNGDRDQGSVTAAPGPDAPS